MSVKLAVKKILRAVMTRDAAITFRANFGVAGDVSRWSPPTEEAQAFGATAFSIYGLAAKVSSNKVIPIAAGGDTVYGFLARPFPITGPNASDPLGTSVPPTTGAANILRRGYMTVNVQAGAASCALGSQVYIRTASPSGGQVLGGVEGASTGNNTALTGLTSFGPLATFTGPADANNNAEIAFNI